MDGLISETNCCFCFTLYHVFSFSVSQELLRYIIDYWLKNLVMCMRVIEKFKTKQTVFLGSNHPT